MNICIIAEGCFPYVAGGVSSWIKMLIEGMTEHKFLLYTIAAEEKMRGVFKYDIPKNLVEIKENFLDEGFKRKITKGRKFLITEQQKHQFRNLIEGLPVNWDMIFDVFVSNKKFDPYEFLLCGAFLEIIEDVCRGKHQLAPFNEVFWTIRSMLMPILSLMKSEVPEADVYHSVSTGYAGIMGARFKYLTGKPLVITEHGIYTREREEEILKSSWVESCFKQTWIDFFYNVSVGAYHSANVITSLFNRAKEAQIELGADRDRCLVIANGINIERFADVNELEVSVKQDAAFSIGAIVRVVPIKDLKTMIYGFEIVKKEIKNAKLFIMGPNDEDQEYFNECIELINILNCPDIVFTGRVNINEWLGKMDLTILTSISEGQPFVVLESMAAKRPVVTTDVGSCREIVLGIEDRFGAAGEIVPVMSPDKIARAIIKLAKDRPLMKKMGQNGSDRVEQFYKEKDFLYKYKTLYGEVTADGGRWI